MLARQRQVQVQVGRGLPLEHLLKPPDCKYVCTWCRVAKTSLYQRVSSLQHRRGFSQSAIFQDKRFPRYFWPARPDFLPTKQVESPRRAGGRAEDIRKSRLYLPTSDMKVVLPLPSEAPQSNRALCNALHSDQSRDFLWALFQEHVNEVKHKDASPLEASLFDSLFWSIASTEELEGDQVEQLSLHLIEMQDFSVKVGHYGLTRLQLHRVILIWNLYWSEKGKGGGSIVFQDYLVRIRQQLQHIHTRLAARIIKQMLEDCDTSAKLRAVLDFINNFREMQTADIADSLRSEQWSNGRSIAGRDNDLYFPKTEARDLLMMSSYRLLTIAGNLPASEEALDAIMEVLLHHEEEIEPERVIDCLKVFNKETLYSLLPKQTRTVIEEQDCELLPSDTSSTIHQSLFSESRIEEIQQKSCYPPLIQAIGASLASRKDCGMDYRLALYLFDQDVSQKKEERSFFETWTGIAAIASLARHAQLSNGSVQPLPLLQKAVNILAKTDWIDTKAGIESALNCLMSLRECKTEASGNVPPSKGDMECSKLLQQYTTILLAVDPELTSLTKYSHRLSFAPLLRMLIDIKEYAFAKHIYIIQSQYPERKLATHPPLSVDQFLWFFQASLTIDTDLKLARLLFTHWESTQNNPKTAYYLPYLPSSLLRMYIGKLIASGKKEGIHTLQLLLDLDRGSSFALDHKNDSRITARHNAIRTCRMVFHAGKDYVEEALEVANTVIQRWQLERGKGFEKMISLIELYAIALEKSTVWLDQSTTLSRAKIILTFEAFRNYFGLVKGTSLRIPSSTLPDDTQRHVQIIYRCAFDTLIRQRRGKALQREIDTYVQDLTLKWRIPMGADIYGTRIEALAKAEGSQIDKEESLTRAIEVFEEGIDVSQQRHELLPSIPVAKLINALTKKSDFTRADKVFQLYKIHTQGESKSTIIMVEAAGIASTFCQGRRLEASWRLQDLINEVQEVDKISDKVKWLRTLRLISRLLKESDAQEMQDALEDSLTLEEKDRLKAYAALAGGQPLKWKWSRDKNRDALVT